MVALLNFVLGQNGLEGSLLHKRLVPGMVGGAGHSLGGYALVGMAGGRDSWREERVGAILLLSPYVLPYLHHGSLKGVTVPVMVQGGTWDLGVTPFLKRFYDQLESAKYYLVLRGAGHFAWTDLNSAGSTTTEALKKGNPRLIAEYSIAFFDRHLKELDHRKALVARGKQVHTWKANGKAE
jgi:predicted dienelactone hydrolase